MKKKLLVLLTISTIAISLNGSQMVPWSKSKKTQSKSNSTKKEQDLYHSTLIKLDRQFRLMKQHELEVSSADLNTMIHALNALKSNSQASAPTFGNRTLADIYHTVKTTYDTLKSSKAAQQGGGALDFIEQAAGIITMHVIPMQQTKSKTKASGSATHSSSSHASSTSGSKTPSRKSVIGAHRVK